MERRKDFFRNFAKQTLVRSPEGQRTAVREAERCDHEGIAAQLFADLRWAGFSASRAFAGLMRSTKLSATTKLSAEHELKISAAKPAYGKCAVSGSLFFCDVYVHCHSFLKIRLQFVKLLHDFPSKRYKLLQPIF